jgi:hypothetical protein
VKYIFSFLTRHGHNFEQQSWNNFFLVAEGLLIAGTVRTAFAQKSHDLI